MEKIATHLVPPRNLPEEGELIPLDYWSQDPHEENLYFMNGAGAPKLARKDIDLRVASGHIVALPKAVKLNGPRKFYCNSIGEVIYASWDKIETDWDYVMTLESKVLAS